MLDYKLIEALAVVSQAGGFDRAAKSLHVTQSAVSQRIKLLEGQTGQILLARTNPPRPTPAGRRIIRHYQQVKRLEDDLFGTFSTSAENAFVTLPLGINGDSLATWFLDAVVPFLENTCILLDLRSDDQEETHRLLKDGEVIGCIGTTDQPLQGCRMDYLGSMVYRMVATSGFAARWFPHGFTWEQVSQAPLLVFNRKDRLHFRFYQLAFNQVEAGPPIHYLPSSEKFVDYICAGMAYGLLPDQQGASLIASGRLVELVPACPVAVKLYWHCWNLTSPLLEKFSRHLVRSARAVLRP